jgi:hypothetical protein
MIWQGVGDVLVLLGLWLFGDVLAMCGDVLVMCWSCVCFMC